jgi:CRP-like cAMP-binding protein
MLKEFHDMRQYLQNLGLVLTEIEWETLYIAWHLKEFKRKTLITTSSEIEIYLYFVLEGVQRVYYQNEDEREATLVFTYPYSFAGVLDSFLLQAPSNYYFEALTNSRMLKISHEDFQNLSHSIPAFDHFARKLVHSTVSGLLQRMVELQCFTSKEKFLVMLKRSPQVLQLVPHKYLANYLGIDPTAFSKLLNSERI